MTARRPVVLPGVRPNAAIREAYQRRLDALIDEMHTSILHWLSIEYRRNEPEMAQDATPADVLRRLLEKLRKRWVARFDELAPELARYFSQKVESRSSATLAAMLKKAGMTVGFRLTDRVRDVTAAAVAENVSLIKSIPAEHLTAVEGLVMRSVAAGRDLGTLAQALQAQHGSTKKRAALIARDQNNKATGAITRARQLDLGVTHAIWRHSAAGKKPRPTHVKAGREQVVYPLNKGWFDPDENAYVFPGELINCRCVGRAIIPGLTRNV